jgi:hypothetical protein
MEQQITLVVEELAHHCATAIREAHQGNTAARRWLVEAFPGNVDQFARLWAGEKITSFDRSTKRRVAVAG